MLLWVLALFRAKRNTECLTQCDIAQLKVTLIISAYNEEKVIENKILNSLAIEYPKELFEIIVVSDASEDNTDRIVRRYSGERLFLQRYEGRLGKTECLNKAVPLANGEIIIFSDANALYDSYSVRELVKHFCDSKIGFVTGATKYIASMHEDRISESIGLYSRLEQITKGIESRISSCVGADGAIFAIRKKLYRQLQDSDINDLVIPFMVIEQGFRGVFDGNAFCREHIAQNMGREFYRQVRITSRTIRAIVNHRTLLNPFRYGLFSFELFSHKICKLCVPYFLLLCLITNVLVSGKGTVYAFLLFTQAAFYVLAAIKSPLPSLHGISSLLAIPKTFALTNFAILWGWVKYFKGETFTAWGINR